MSPAMARKIAEAKTSVSGNRIQPGHYVLVVKQILCNEGGYNGAFVIPEFDVVDAEKTNGEGEPNRVGSDCSCAWQIDAKGEKGEAMRGNAKKFIAALMALDLGNEDAINKALNDHCGAAGDKDALRARGMLVECTTQRRRIKTGPNAGQEGDFPEFKHVLQTPAEIAERRAQLDRDRR